MNKPTFGMSFGRGHGRARHFLAAALLLGSGAAILSCNVNRIGPNDDGGTADMAAVFMGPYSDFPQNPIAAGGISPGNIGNVAGAFAGATNNPSGGPCMSEPSLGALYPRNFNPPLFEWTAGMGQNTFELRLHVDNQVNDLLVFTDQTSYTLPTAIWSMLSSDSSDHDMVITVRGGQLVGNQLMGGAFLGTTGSVHIAPVMAAGAIVYWTTSSNTALKGFHIGDTQVQTVLTPDSISNAPGGKATTCVGCHASSPDGLLAFFGRADPRFSVDARLVDGTSGPPSPSQVTANALQNLARTNQDLPTLSRAHYALGDAVVVTVMNNAATNGNWELVWTDLLATSNGSGTLMRTGDTGAASTPSWSHDGQTIIYTSSNNVVDGRPDTGNGDIFSIPYNNRQGGTAQPVPGLNDDNNYNQYYPVFSPNDKFIAYNRNPRGSQMYNSPTAEVWVAPAAGGTPTRLAANDPPACTGLISPGQTNSWPRWSPSVSNANGKHYYWLVFSSHRRPAGNPQLFLSAIVTHDDPSGAGEILDATYPALYIPTQPATENNHTPAWDDFMIPIG